MRSKELESIPLAACPRACLYQLSPLHTIHQHPMKYRNQQVKRLTKYSTTKINSARLFNRPTTHRHCLRRVLRRLPSRPRRPVFMESTQHRVKPQYVTPTTTTVATIQLCPPPPLQHDVNTNTGIVHLPMTYVFSQEVQNTSKLGCHQSRHVN